MLTEKPNSAIFDRDFYSPEIIELIEELHKGNGCSSDLKYLPLLEIGLAYTFRTSEKEWIISKLFFNQNDFVTLMYRVPPPEDLEQNPKSIKSVESIKNLISKWFIFEDITYVSESKIIEKYLTKYIGVFQVKSIPVFILEEFLKDLEETGAEYVRIDPEYKDVVCPACDFSFKVFSSEQIKTCPDCKAIF